MKKLVSTLKYGETINIGDLVTIRIEKAPGRRVKLVISAEDGVKVERLNGFIRQRIVETLSDSEDD